MKLCEYIEILKQYPDQNIRVTKAGYEDGYNDIKGEMIPIMVVLNHNTDRWYYGNHTDADRFNVSDEERKSAVEVLVLT